MSKMIKDDNFYTVLGWMLNVLKLKGNELIIFAIIYSFSQDGKSEFKGSIKYLQSFANIKSHVTVMGILKKLTDNQRIVRREFKSKNVSRVAYSANLEEIANTRSEVTEMQSTIKDENFYTVLGWMLNALKLKGNELITFAIIYSFSQDGKSEFTGSLTYLEDFANVDRKTAIASLSTLTEAHLILRREYKDGNVARVAYRTNSDEIDRLITEYENS